MVANGVKALQQERRQRTETTKRFAGFTNGSAGYRQEGSHDTPIARMVDVVLYGNLGREHC